MNLAQIFCPNLECPAKGQCGRDNIRVHSLKEKRCYCQVCHKTFSVTKGSLFYRLKTAPETVILVLTLLAHGCPLQAIVIGFGLDERTVKMWWQRAGQHCQAVHEHVVGGSQLDLQQVQADEIRVKMVGGVIWMAMAMMVSSRLPWVPGWYGWAG
jgi:transposase-like protein